MQGRQKEQHEGLPQPSQPLISELPTSSNLRLGVHHSPGLPAPPLQPPPALQASSQAFTCPPGGANSVSVVLQQAERLYELTCWHPVLGEVYLSQALQYTANG